MALNWNEWCQRPWDCGVTAEKACRICAKARQPLNVLDLFSGIGGFSLGLERAGMRTVAFCEIDPYCRRVLAKHWPEVPCYDDIRTLTAERLAADGIAVGLICGGFPCQDISFAGKGAGLAGERSGLWREYARLIGELRPRYVIVENVAALLGRGLGDVLGDLASLGYDAEWHCIPASSVGAPHIRDRLWIVANAQHPDADGTGLHRATGNPWSTEPRDKQGGDAEPLGAVLADSTLNRRQPRRASNTPQEPGGWQLRGGGFCKLLADAKREGLEVRQGIAGDAGEELPPAIGGRDLPHPAHYVSIGEGVRRGDAAGWWRAEPDVGRVAHGVPARVDRLRALGNAVVPQIPELIGRAILAAEAEQKAAA